MKGFITKAASVICLFFFANAQAQQYDILLQHGHVVDPKNKIDTILDIAITGDKVVKVGRNIDTATAKKK